MIASLETLILFLSFSFTDLSMDKSVNEKDKNKISVSKDAIIETVAEQILSQENPANVLDENNNVVGSVKPSKIIQTVFRTGKERP